MQIQNKSLSITIFFILLTLCFPQTNITIYNHGQGLIQEVRLVKFKQNGDLKRHKSMIHDIDVKWYQCDRCDYKAKRNDSIKIHKSMIHDINIKWHQCDLCNYKAKQSSHLKIHKSSIHDIDVKWHQCDQCDYKSKKNKWIEK